MFKLKHKLMNEAAEGGDPGMVEEQQPAPDLNEMQKRLEALEGEKEALLSKNQELLGETKKAKQSRREAEEKARIEAEEKARKAGDFEQLFKSQQQQAEQYKADLEALRGNIAKEKQQNVAMKLASDLAEGHNAEILSEFVARRLKYTDDGVKILDNNGDLTVSTLDQLKAEFQNDARYASLLRGSQASGGSASGGKASSPTEKVMTRQEFEQTNHTKRMEFVKSGGKIVD